MVRKGDNDTGPGTGEALYISNSKGTVRDERMALRSDAFLLLPLQTETHRE